jgi:hypothetical protein
MRKFILSEDLQIIRDGSFEQLIAQANQAIQESDKYSKASIVATFDKYVVVLTESDEIFKIVATDGKIVSEEKINTYKILDESEYESKIKEMKLIEARRIVKGMLVSEAVDVSDLVESLK